MPRWSERQQAMLREMGVRHFWPAEPAIASEPSAVTEPPGVTRPDAAASAPPVSMARLSDVLAQPGTPIDAPGRAVAGVESMDWPQLRETVAACRACGLCEGRRQTVFGVGNPKARWMIVGEAPGEQEDREGEPFVGRSGQLLDRMLGALDLTRQPPEDPTSTATPSQVESDRQVYIANVIKCRPPGNRNPLPDEVSQCEPYLLRQVALVRPSVIVAMGRFAVQSLLKSTDPIGRLRGRVHDYHGVPLIVTYHPAYLLRNPIDKAMAWDDLCLAREVAARDV